MTLQRLIQGGSNLAEILDVSTIKSNKANELLQSFDGSGFRPVPYITDFVRVSLDSIPRDYVAKIFNFLLEKMALRRFEL